MGAAEPLPLLPLPAVLFPGARMAVQIFEARYLDLVSRCLREGGGFGIIRLLDGSEVYSVGRWREPRVAAVGCLAQIVDWAALPHGRLRVTVEGIRRFNVARTHCDRARVVHGSVAWLPVEPVCPLPDVHADLPGLLDSIVRHPEVARLGMRTDRANAACVGNQLAQLLPMPIEQRQELLELHDPLARLRAIESLLARLQ